jgi:DNA recombination protein RmuC
VIVDWHTVSLSGLVILGIAWILALFRGLRSSAKYETIRRELELVRLSCSEMETRLLGSEQKAESLRNELGAMSGLRLELERELAASKASLHQHLEHARQWESAQSRMEQRFRDVFEALSAQALQTSNTAFLELARVTFEKLQDGARTDLRHRQESIEAVVAPIGTSLKELQQRIQELELQRSGQVATLMELVNQLSHAHDLTRAETRRLSDALRAPQVRGQWGEMHLRRTIEMAGMVPYCDFVEQVHLASDEQSSRPDVVVRLPNNRQIVIDAKAPLGAYLEAMECSDPGERTAKLKLHARQIREHCGRLSRKTYQDQLEGSPEFVVLFLPGEVFYSAALEQEPALIEQTVERKVLIATPTTLIALLKAVAYGWKNQELADQALEIGRLGRDLHASIGVVLDHLGQVRKGLQQTMTSFNQVVRSSETRLLPRVRRLEAMGAASDKALQAPESLAGELLATPSVGLPVDGEIPPGDLPS